jgi:hypothetical protein
LSAALFLGWPIKGRGAWQQGICFVSVRKIKAIKCVYQDNHISCRRVTEVLQNSATRLKNKDLRTVPAATELKTAGKTPNRARYAGQLSPDARRGRGDGGSGACFLSWSGECFLISDF